MSGPTGPNQDPPPGYTPPGFEHPAHRPAPPAPPVFEPGSLTFAEAVRSVLAQYATFSGRARRSEFWWYQLFGFLVGVVASVLDTTLDTDLVSTVVTLALLVPSLAVGARRLHDTDRTGWWQLIALVPLAGLIVLIVFWCQDSQAGPNGYGPSAKYPVAASY